jgi:hypothetical protein
MKATLEEDPARQEQKMMFGALEDAFGVNMQFTVAEIVIKSEERLTQIISEKGQPKRTPDGDYILQDMGPKYRLLVDAVREVAWQGNDVSHRQLGVWLTKNRNVTLGEDNDKERTYKSTLVSPGERQGSRIWMLRGKVRPAAF